MNIVYSYDKESDGYIVTDIESDSKTILIPESHKGKPIKKIGPNAFGHCVDAEVVLLPLSVEMIEERAFPNYLNLQVIFFYGKDHGLLDNLRIEKGNRSFLFSRPCLFSGEPIAFPAYEEWFAKKGSLYLECGECHTYEEIEYLRASLVKWAAEKGYKGFWLYSGEFEEESPMIPEDFSDYDFLVLDGVDDEAKSSRLALLKEAVAKAMKQNLPIIGLSKRHKTPEIPFKEHRIILDPRDELFYNEPELKVALETLKKAKDVSVSTLQREMAISFPKAKRYFDLLLENGFFEKRNGKYMLKW